MNSTFYSNSTELAEDEYPVNSSVAGEGQWSKTHCSLGRDNFISVLVLISYITIFIVGLIGNSTVVGRTCLLRCRSSVDMYIVNLAIANLLFISTLPFWILNTLQNRWPFGSVMCKLCSFASSLNMYSSVFFITCLSIDRYLAIAYPGTSLKMQRISRVLVSSCLIWVTACAVSLPTIFLHQSSFSKERNTTVCTVVYPRHHTAQWTMAIDLGENMVGFVIPFLLLGVIYLLIYRALNHTLKPETSKQGRMLETASALLLAFLICWLPFQTVTFLRELVKFQMITDCRLVSVIEAALPVTVCVAYSHSCINPILSWFCGGYFKNRPRKPSLPPTSIYMRPTTVFEQEKSGERPAEP